MDIKRKIVVMVVLCFYSFCLVAQTITASYAPGSSKTDFTGKVLLFLSGDNRLPKDAMAGVESFPCFSITVNKIKPGQKVVFDNNSISYPAKLSDIQRGLYYAQVVWDKNLGGRSIGESPGNIYNDAVRVNITRNRDQVFSILCDKVVKERPFVETQFVKEIKQPSKLLSAFYKKAITINAAVLLPKEYYEQPGRFFPVLYWVSGFGGDYHSFSGKNINSQPIDTTACIRVFLDGNCSLGHCVYANSDNNGPWGDALMTELIPEVGKEYRTNKVRLLMGHSSGGWTVLWLQTHYPKAFTACWSSSPDPVDFRSFQQVNLYKDKNIFYDEDSSLRMAASVAGRYPWIYMKTMYEMEHVMYRGEQLHSFDAVFSTRNKNGTPRRLINEHTGEIDQQTVEHWKNYDISLYLRTNWEKLKPNLQGKIRVSVGEQDNFLLNYAVQLLDDEMKKVNAGFQFSYYPGDHFTVSTPEYKLAGEKFLEQKINEIKE